MNSCTLDKMERKVSEKVLLTFCKNYTLFLEETYTLGIDKQTYTASEYRTPTKFIVKYKFTINCDSFHIHG